MRARIWAPRICLLVVAVAATLFGQTGTTGTIVGTISDESSAVVPGAQIELRDLASNTARTVTTNAAGQYTFPNVQPGRISH